MDKTPEESLLQGGRVTKEDEEGMITTDELVKLILKPQEELHEQAPKS